MKNVWNRRVYPRKRYLIRSLIFDAKIWLAYKMPPKRLFIGLSIAITFVKRMNSAHKKYSPNQIKHITLKHWLKYHLIHHQINPYQLSHPNWFQIGEHNIKPIYHLFAIINHKFRPIPIKFTAILRQTSPFMVIWIFGIDFFLLLNRSFCTVKNVDSINCIVQNNHIKWLLLLRLLLLWLNRVVGFLAKEKYKLKRSIQFCAIILNNLLTSVMLLACRFCFWTLLNNKTSTFPLQTQLPI